MKNLFNRKPKEPVTDPKDEIIAKLRDQIRDLQRSNIPNNERGQIKYVFTSTGGKKYYTWEQITDIPMVRFTELQRLLKIAEMGLTVKLAEQFRDSLKQHAERGDLTEFFVIFNRFMERFKLKTTPEILLEQAAVIYLEDGEDWQSFDQATAKRKIQDWKKDPEVLAFFLTLSAKELLGVTTLSPDVFLNSLKELEEWDRRLSPLLSSQNSISLLESIATSHIASAMEALKKSKPSGD